jgi:hypothetical protein
VNGDIVIVSGVERSLDTESGGGISERSCLQGNIFTAVRDRKQVSTFAWNGTRNPFKTPVLIRKPRFYHVSETAIQIINKDGDLS